MEDYHISRGKHFYTIGLSYKKADADIRGHFSLTEEAKENLLIQAGREGIDGILLTSTCNRTEIYGFAEHPFQLIKLLCEHTHGTVEEFEKVAYVYKNKQAIAHIFRVGTGLDSQILGDFEIISQLKVAFVRSKNLGLVNAFLERLVNAVIQASKRIKNETEISSGATSVSFASVQYILKNIENVSEKNILLFGTGKIGRNTCENLVKHTRNNHIQQFHSKFDGIMFYSPSGVQSHTTRNTINATAFCIGETTAAEAKKHTTHIVMPGTPGIENLIAAVAKTFRKN